ncbi:SMR family transporter [Aquibacillus sp. 3ASR75-11]|uniref:SMR family transporter n=1 Tax=Terrihalobacillus insolitus TaxID=2950438 RepID=A0A9X3WMW8_9BACI|nr:SMR family transporter [Terrihalobacillus insolitus]MDC3412325.1 SMR family transporter [Terrihalobacillus insolitus]MDC3422982.1 SMR family transporter [Terrihalobacillus insolitus]
MRRNNHWFIVIIAGIFEIGWVIGLKHASNGLEWVGTVFAIFVSMYLLIIASKQLPVGTAYAVFTGIGTAGTTTLEIILFGAPFKLAKVLLIGLLLAGIIGLKTASYSEHKDEKEEGYS